MKAAELLLASERNPTIMCIGDQLTQRLCGVSNEEATGLAAEIIEASNLFLGRTSNLVRILAAHSPLVARWFLGLVAAVRQPNLGASSDVRLRNIATHQDLDGE